MNAYSPHLDILLATWEGGGNVPPVLGAARHLIAHGHRVRIMADAVAGPAAVQAGAEFRAWQRAPSRRDHSPATDLLRDWAGPDEGRASVVMQTTLRVSGTRTATAT